jgi:hypothetical protein
MSAAIFKGHTLHFTSRSLIKKQKLHLQCTSILKNTNPNLKQQIRTFIISPMVSKSQSTLHKQDNIKQNPNQLSGELNDFNILNSIVSIQKE